LAGAWALSVVGALARLAAHGGVKVEAIIPTEIAALAVATANVVAATAAAIGALVVPAVVRGAVSPGGASARGQVSAGANACRGGGREVDQGECTIVGRVYSSARLGDGSIGCALSGELASGGSVITGRGVVASQSLCVVASSVAVDCGGGSPGSGRVRARATLCSDHLRASADGPLVGSRVSIVLVAIETITAQGEGVVFASVVHLCALGTAGREGSALRSPGIAIVIQRATIARAGAGCACGDPCCIKRRESAAAVRGIGIAVEAAIGVLRVHALGHRAHGVVQRAVARTTSVDDVGGEKLFVGLQERCLLGGAGGASVAAFARNAGVEDAIEEGAVIDKFINAVG